VKFIYLLKIRYSIFGGVPEVSWELYYIPTLNLS